MVWEIMKENTGEWKKFQNQQEQKVLKTSAPRVNFMYSKQKSKNIYLKSHKKSEIVPNSLKYRVSEISVIRNNGYQKYWISDILGIRNSGYPPNLMFLALSLIKKYLVPLPEL